MRSILNALQEGRLFELPDSDKASALEFLARILDANPDIEVGTDAIEEVKRRELECNTGIGAGVAVPHVRTRREEGELFCAIGWTAPGIDYGAPEGGRVHLVFMYYIPGAQKNVYLKEISSLVKAIRRTGGIEPIAHAPDLNAVRHLLLDWVGAVLGDSGPEAVARMIRLETRQARTPAPPAPTPPASAAVPRLIPVQFLVLAPDSAVVLSADAGWSAEAEKDPALVGRLAANQPFPLAGREVFVTGTRSYPGGRALHDGVAITRPASTSN